MSQSTITQQVLQFETAYGVELFYRLGRRISATGPLDLILVAALVAKANPAARISLTICNSEKAKQSLLEFRADVAMLATAQSDPRFHYVDFGSRPLVHYVSRDHEWAKWRLVR
ncbi:uncharacterized protein METZ01_LOCUS480379, partial [marine metagenome]